MGNLYRFGIALEQPLIEAFDNYVKAENYKNRSDAIRDLIRERLIEKKRTDDGLVAGALSVTFDHHKHELVENLISVQHDFHDIIISSQHVHLDHDNCLEIIAVRGRSGDIEELASRLRAFFGVKHLNLSLSAYGVED